jgi:hypothetical protein
VTIIDPHLRAEDDYPVFVQAKERQLLVRTADNTTEHIRLQPPLHMVTGAHRGQRLALRGRLLAG